MSKTRLVNIKYDKYDIYIGRAVPRKGLKESIWANPFKSPQHGSVEQCIEMYRMLLRERQATTSLVFDSELEKLRGKVLACWCKPGICHGDVLVELLGE